MIETKHIFADSTKKEWVDQLTKDLKDQSIEILRFKDDIEEIDLASYQHKEDDQHHLTQLSSYPFDRGFQRANNSWNNGIQIEVSDEKEANKLALYWLMNGVNYLAFVPKKENINWKEVLKDIGLEHIRSHFDISNPEDVLELLKHIGNTEAQISFSATKDRSQNETLLDQLRSGQKPVFCVNAFELHQAGASSFQEIGYALNYGHDLILSLMNSGFTIDEAAACLHFQFGVGNKYLIESAKFNVFRALWAKIVHAYQPEHNCSHRAEITAITGHVNKSLKDPYTNILRQTTEALSAINGAVENLLVLPYDALSTRKSALAQRMAVNISLILGEEAHLDKVIDPLGGSYVVDAISKELAAKAWNFFLELEKRENHELRMDYLKERVKEKRERRIADVKSGKEILIGINKYPNPDTTDLEWVDLPFTSETGLPSLILEKEIEL